jgi:hypothetical protein
MRYNWYPVSRCQRGRLRIRKNNSYQSGPYTRKQYFPTTLHVYHRLQTAEKDRKLPLGYSVGQTWGALHKAWLGYCIALYKDEGEKTLYYASIVQKLQRELGIQVREFAEVDMFGSVIDKEESKLAVIDPSLMKRYRMLRKTKTNMWRSILKVYSYHEIT